MNAPCVEESRQLVSLCMLAVNKTRGRVFRCVRGPLRLRSSQKHEIEAAKVERRQATKQDAAVCKE